MFPYNSRYNKCSEQQYCVVAKQALIRRRHGHNHGSEKFCR